MNTNMIGLDGFSKVFVSLCFGIKVASALEGLSTVYLMLFLGIQAAIRNLEVGWNFYFLPYLGLKGKCTFRMI